MVVYVLFNETNTGRSGDSDGFVEAAYATDAAAEAARLAVIRKARDEGKAIYYDPDAEEFPGESRRARNAIGALCNTRLKGPMSQSCTSRS